MKYALLLLLNVITLSAYTQISHITLNPSKPESGQKITITYTGKLAKAGTKMYHIFCFDDDYRIPQKGIKTQLINNELTGTFILPDSVSFFTIKIVNKKEIDNNGGKGYGFNVYEGDKPKKGTFFEQGYTNSWNEFIFRGDVEREKALELIEKEYTLHPDMRESTLPYYIEHLSRIPIRKTEAMGLAKENFKEILKTGGNEIFSSRYANIIANGNYKVADSLKKLVVQKYPNGFTALNKNFEILSYYSQVKPDTAITLYENIVKSFPHLSKRQYRALTVELLVAYAKKYDFENLDLVFNSLVEKDKSEQVFIMVGGKLNEVASGISEENKDLRQAKIIIEKSILSHQSYDTLSTFYGDALNTYAEILFKLGDKKSAIINQKKAIYLKNYIFTDLNKRLIQYLIADGQFQEARTLSEEYIKDNVSNPIIDSLYKVAYVASTGSEIGFEKANISVKEKSENANMLVLKQKMINIDAPDFKLRDLNGNLVRLSDFKGSILVLDFWATWCAPCIASFPAMKKAMIELKDKPVKFLFIDTMENEEIKNKDEKINRILSTKKVEDFHVLIDEMKDLNYKVTTAYNVQGIPAKFVIDTNGKIRYKSEGFGSEEKLIKELKSVVEIISE
ncbi:TlpA disulfide reductase family protein [Arcicella aquatica]|uniref:TlpA disulfide reductase family protein n=1 Tax=Arcicella aquatica TaxID=217141 RepID=A0ABU5QUN1_9BACT|nr:TlpA disulfide reductase family protein [Arcicella aquatica]MEA5260812.1 TlpA disulfide reductase family protein [Arcicella aquatica]